MLIYIAFDIGQMFLSLVLWRILHSNKMYYRSLLKSHEHPCIDNQCLSLQIQRYLCPTGSALKSIFGVVNDKCTFILLACFPKLGHPLCLLCFCFFIFHNRYLSLLAFRFIMDLPAKLQQFSDIRKFFPSFAKLTYQKSDRFAVRPLHCPTATLSGCAGVPAFLTASLSDRFTERLI